MQLLFVADAAQGKPVGIAATPVLGGI